MPCPAGSRFRLRGIDLPRVFDLLAVVGDEVVQPILPDRAAEAEAVLVLRRRRQRHAGGLALLLERRLRAPVGAGAVDVGIAVQLVGARLRDRGDRRAADLLELGLVVLRDHLVFGDRRLRERVAARAVLPGQTAAQDVVLLADAVDEHIDVVDVLRAGLDARVAAGVLHERDAGRQVGRAEEVVRRLRQRLDELPRHVGAQLRCAHVLPLRAADDGDRLQRGRGAAEREVERRRLAHLQGDDVGACAAGRAADADLVVARGEAGERVAAVGERRRAVGVAVRLVDRADREAGRCRLAVAADLALHRRRAQLRMRNACTAEPHRGSQHVPAPHPSCATHGSSPARPASWRVASSSTFERPAFGRNLLPAMPGSKVSLSRRKSPSFEERTALISAPAR